MSKEKFSNVIKGLTRGLRTCLVYGQKVIQCDIMD